MSVLFQKVIETLTNNSAIVIACIDGNVAKGPSGVMGGD